MNAHVPLFAIIVEVSILSFCSFTEEWRQNNKNSEQWKKKKKQRYIPALNLEEYFFFVQQIRKAKF